MIGYHFVLCHASLFVLGWISPAIAGIIVPVRSIKVSTKAFFSEAIFDSFWESKESAGRRLPAPVLIHEVTLYRSSFSTSHVASLLFIIQDEPHFFPSSLPLILSVFICIRSIVSFRRNCYLHLAFQSLCLIFLFMFQLIYNFIYFIF